MTPEQVKKELLLIDSGESAFLASQAHEVIIELEQKIVELQKREVILNALEVMGVDNWDGYDEAMERLTDH